MGWVLISTTSAAVLAALPAEVLPQLAQETPMGDGSSLYLGNMYVRTENGKSYVMARGENGKLEQRWVQTGKVVWDSYTQIRGGLTQEDYVAFPYGRDVVSGAKTEEATVDALYSW